MPSHYILWSTHLSDIVVGSEFLDASDHTTRGFNCVTAGSVVFQIRTARCRLSRLTSL